MLPGKIRFAWAHSKDDGADWFSVSQVPADTGTRNYVLCELSRIGEELVRRGYDRASIRFECAKPNAQLRDAAPTQTQTQETHE